MSRWRQAVAVVAALAAGTGLAYGTYTMVRTTVAGPPTDAPAASSSALPSAAADPCAWAALPEEERLPLAEQPEGLPAAYALTPAVWACADETWTVEVETVEGDGYPMGVEWQSLYLRTPAGERVLLYGLRNDVLIEVVGQDVPARVAWLARVSEADSFQVVQMDLVDGLVVEDWGGGGVPRSQRHDGGVWDVRADGPLDGGGELWTGFTPQGGLSAVFRRTDARAFASYSGQRSVDALVAEGSVDAAGQPGTVMWVAEDRSFALALAQHLAGGSDPTATTGEATWVVIDLERDLSRLAASSVPTALCVPVPDAALTGTFDAPGTVRVECPAGGPRWDLAVGADATPVG